MGISKLTLSAWRLSYRSDANDFKAGKKNNLEFITILDENGAIDAPGCKFHGMMRYDCRNGENNDDVFVPVLLWQVSIVQSLRVFDCLLSSSAILEELKATGAYRGKKDNEMVIPICSRSGDVIEPRMTPQVQCLHCAVLM